MSLLKPLSHIQIRFNTKNNGGPLPWRLFIDGEEYLASQVEITGFVFGESSYEGDVQKYNVACVGRVAWAGTGAKIKARKRTGIERFLWESATVYSKTNLL